MNTSTPARPPPTPKRVSPIPTPTEVLPSRTKPPRKASLMTLLDTPTSQLSIIDADTRATRRTAEAALSARIRGIADNTAAATAALTLTDNQSNRARHLIRTQLAVAALIANSDGRFDLADLPLGDVTALTGRLYAPVTIDWAQQNWAQLAYRCHRWRGHTASLRAADR